MIPGFGKSRKAGDAGAASGTGARLPAPAPRAVPAATIPPQASDEIEAALARRAGSGSAIQSRSVRSVRQAIDRNPEFAATALRMLMHSD